MNLREQAIANLYIGVVNPEVDEEAVASEMQMLKTEYARKRAIDYPSIGDQLDALWKGGEAMEEMRARVLAIKDKYPKAE